MDSYTLLSKKSIFYILQNVKYILGSVKVFLNFFEKKMVGGRKLVLGRSRVTGLGPITVSRDS